MLLLNVAVTYGHNYKIVVELMKKTRENKVTTTELEEDTGMKTR